MSAILGKRVGNPDHWPRDLGRLYRVAAQRAMSDELKRLRARLARRKRRRDAPPASNGNAGLASNFLDLAHAKLRPGGTLALVMPASLALGGSWKPSRALLAMHYEKLVIVSLAGARSEEKARRIPGWPRSWCWRASARTPCRRIPLRTPFQRILRRTPKRRALPGSRCSASRGAPPRPTRPRGSSRGSWPGPAKRAGRNADRSSRYGSAANSRAAASAPPSGTAALPEWPISPSSRRRWGSRRGGSPSPGAAVAPYNSSPVCRSPASESWGPAGRSTGMSGAPERRGPGARPLRDRPGPGRSHLPGPLGPRRHPRTEARRRPRLHGHGAPGARAGCGLAVANREPPPLQPGLPTELPEPHRLPDAERGHRGPSLVVGDPDQRRCSAPGARSTEGCGISSRNTRRPSSPWTKSHGQRPAMPSSPGGGPA